MKYLMLIYGNQEKWDSILGEKWPQEIAKQDAFNRKYAGTGELIAFEEVADGVQAKALLVVQFRDLLSALAATPLILTHRPAAASCRAP